MSTEDTGGKLAAIIKKAMDDLEISTTEYQEILAQVNADGVVDSEEQRLLKQLHEMIANGTVTRVPG